MNDCPFEMQIESSNVGVNYENLAHPQTKENA